MPLIEAHLHDVELQRQEEDARERDERDLALAEVETA
jgi:hypothetical protein